jgi:hypothetical protein
MSRSPMYISGGVLALLFAGAASVGPRTASAGVALVGPREVVAPQCAASSTSQSDGSAIDGWWQPGLPAAQALPRDGVADARLSPMFSESDAVSTGPEAAPISVSLPNHFAPPGLGHVRGEHVNSIPDLPALWSGLTSLAGILTAGSVRRLRRALK